MSASHSLLNFPFIYRHQVFAWHRSPEDPANDGIRSFIPDVSLGHRARAMVMEVSP